MTARSDIYPPLIITFRPTRCHESSPGFCQFTAVSVFCCCFVFGQDDAVGYDTTGDGQADAYDLDGDGVIDAYLQVSNTHSCFVADGYGSLIGGFAVRRMRGARRSRRCCRAPPCREGRGAGGLVRSDGRIQRPAFVNPLAW